MSSDSTATNGITSNPNADLKASGNVDKRERNKRECTQYFQRNLAQLKPHIKKTTTTPSGQIVDWILPEAQGTVAEPPPSPQDVSPLDASKAETPQQSKLGGKPTAAATPELELPGVESGPDGTVPILRQQLELLNFNKSLEQRLSKTGVAKSREELTAAPAAPAPHWYASTAQAVPNFGGEAYFSTFKSFVQSNSDFSLLQVAVVKDNVVSIPTADKRQTVEAGWINYPAQVQQPHLFTFYTTNGYASFGDNVSGWNRDVKGWVQYDKTIFPGTVFTPLSVDGGDQHDIKIWYKLYRDNWWLSVMDRWIGYYPASLFRAHTTNPAQTLSAGSDEIAFYGEIFDSDGGPGPTTTDMGSGEYAETRWTHAAFVRNIQYQAGSGDGNSQTDYDGSGQVIVSDPKRYDIETHFKSGSSWGSYFWVGGPGAGGKIGA